MRQKVLFSRLKQSAQIVAVICLCLVQFSCTKDTEDVDEIKIKAPLKGYKLTARLDNKQSGTESTATGILTGTYDEATKSLVYKVEFGGLEPKSIKVKRGARGSVGSLIFEVPRDSLNTYVSGLSAARALTALQERDLIKGIWFVVIETEKYPQQEIRGQITLKSN